MKTLLSLAVFACLAIQCRGADGPILPAVEGKLVALDGKKLKKFDTASLAGTKYFAIYYSASWCGPCRQFTPDLVKWYEQNKKNNPHFELIFVSSDHSEDDMEGYMVNDSMPWPALDFDKKRSSKTLTQYAGPGIPCLVLLDDQGKVLSDSYEGKNYVGPRKVLEDIEDTLKNDPASPEAVAAAAASKPAQAGSSSFDDFFKKKPAQ